MTATIPWPMKEQFLNIFQIGPTKLAMCKALDNENQRMETDRYMLRNGYRSSFTGKENLNSFRNNKFAIKNRKFRLVRFRTLHKRYEESVFELLKNV